MRRRYDVVSTLRVTSRQRRTNVDQRHLGRAKRKGLLKYAQKSTVSGSPHACAVASGLLGSMDTYILKWPMILIVDSKSPDHTARTCSLSRPLAVHIWPEIRLLIVTTYHFYLRLLPLAEFRISCRYMFSLWRVSESTLWHSGVGLYSGNRVRIPR